jgi:toxin ParE1/3/4
MSHYRLSPLAESDLDDIWLRIAQDASVDTADQVIGDVVNRFGLLADHPQAGRTRDEIAAGVRSFAVESYIIYYRPDPDDVSIARTCTEVAIRRPPSTNRGSPAGGEFWWRFGGGFWSRRVPDGSRESSDP